jgi:hypothetical protein
MNMNRRLKADAQDRGAAPTPTITGRDLTGQPQNRATGLRYYQARFYVPGLTLPAPVQTGCWPAANAQAWVTYHSQNACTPSATDTLGS